MKGHCNSIIYNLYYMLDLNDTYCQYQNKNIDIHMIGNNIYYCSDKYSYDIDNMYHLDPTYQIMFIMFNIYVCYISVTIFHL